jgi:predicted ATPase
VSLAFCGRQSEVAALQTAWSTTGEEDVPIVVVHGEAGIGKTRTVSEFARSVRNHDGEVLWGTCYEGGSDRPYGVWVGAVGGYLDRLGLVALRAKLGDDARWLAPLLRNGAEGDRAAVGVPAAVARVRLAEVLRRLLDAIPTRAAVILDDMQWADADSLELLTHVAQLVKDPLIVVIFRGTGLEMGHPLAQRLAEITRQRSCEYVALDRLPREDALRLLEQGAGTSLDAQTVDALYLQSGGNPFFLGELGRYLQNHDDVTNVPDSGRHLPESIRAAVGLRVAGLSAETRRMLQLASVFTAGFDFAELQALTDLQDESLLDCLDQALDEELVHALDAERYDFGHALVRQTLYEELSSSRRIRLHRRLAEALERLHAEDPGQVAGELVRQYHASATLPGAERGAALAVIAGRAARAAYAPEDAMITLRRGLDLAGVEDHDTRGRLLSELALAQADCGLFPEARATLEAAVSLLEHRTEGADAVAELVYLLAAE